MDSIIIYFSRADENYFGGTLKYIEKGNTECLMEKLQEITKSDIFKIVPNVAYSKDYANCIKEARLDLERNSRPCYKGDIDISKYEVIYLGYPNYWGTIPPVLMTFLENHNFNGKVIVPICTNEGSGFGNSKDDILKLASGAKLDMGLEVRGSLVNSFNIEESLKKIVR